MGYFCRTYFSPRIAQERLFLLNRKVNIRHAGLTFWSYTLERTERDIKYPFLTFVIISINYGAVNWRNWKTKWLFWARENSCFNNVVQSAPCSRYDDRLDDHTKAPRAAVRSQLMGYVLLKKISRKLTRVNILLLSSEGDQGAKCDTKTNTMEFNTAAHFVD